MYLSLNLLKQFLPIIGMDSIENIEVKLNSLGIEIEEVIQFQKTKNLAIGQIKSMSKPQMDSHVNLCEVQIGTKTHKIICGGQNIKPGDKVVVAKIGAVLPGNKEIGKRKIMGIESEGMICGYSELNDVFCNVSDIEKEWVIVLDKTLTDMKLDPLKLIGLDDTILDLSIPSNRNDLNGIFWIVNELSPFYSFDFKNTLNKKEITLKPSYISKLTGNINKYFFIGFETDEFDVSWKVKTSLLNSGLTPSNTILDLAKVTQVLTGVPVFGFDAKGIKKVSFGTLEKKKEVTINKSKISLSKGTNVVLADNDILIVPGIGTNDKYAITKESKDIYFFGSSICVEEINKIINTNKLSSVDSKLASRGYNENLVEYAYSNLIDVLSVKYKKINIAKKAGISEAKPIKLDVNKLNNILNTKISANEVKSILTSFGYKQTANGYIAPVNRNDIENEMDIIEDVLKIYGINNIEPSGIESSKLVFYNQKKTNLVNDIKTYFLSNGIFEVKTYNLCSEKEIGFNFFNYKEPIKIENPISNEREYMRLSLLSGILDTLSFNSRMNNELYPIFEIQDVYKKVGIDKHLICAVSQNVYENKINKTFVKNDLFYLKELVTNVLLMNKITPEFDINFKEEFGCVNDSLNILIGKEKVGYITRISPTLLKEYKINTEALYVCEINLNAFLDNNEPSKLVSNVSMNQNVIKEITFTVDESYDLNEVYKIFKKQDLFINYKFVSEFKVLNKVSYTVSFELNQENPNSSNFDNIIKFFEDNKLSIKK